MRFPTKYILAFLAFLLVFGCIYVLNYWHQQRLVKEPLVEALMQIEGVKDVELANERKSAEVWITLNEVEDLPQTYGDIEKILIAAYGQDFDNIYLIDTRDSYLESVYHKIHYDLWEGERLGNYSKMKETVIEQLAEEKDLTNYRLWVDQKRIYLLLTTSRSNLYEIIPVITAGM